MADLPPWPALATLGAGAANLLLIRYLWPWRDAPGGRWFLVTIGVQAAWCLVYGVALATFDPALRRALELLAWVPVNWVPVLFLGFALEYTGRVDVRRSPAFGAAVAFEVVSTAIGLTNPLHNLLWRDVRIEPTFGAATVASVHEPWLFVQFVVGLALTALAIFVLLDTVISYGPLFRRQAVAIALTPFPPGLAFVAWAFELGPAPLLNLTPMMFFPHALLDVYALFRQDVFEFPPTVRRTGERAAVDDLATAVVVVDTEGRIVTLNDAAEALVDADKRAVQGEPLLERYDGDPVDLAVPEQSVELRVEGERRAFNVAVSELADAAGTHVGYTVVFQDVTAERSRKQRLQVLNRILRHNLRNDLGVVGAYADHIAETESGETADLAASIREQSDDLLAVGEKARRAADVLGDGAGEGGREVPVAELLEGVAEDLRESHPDGRIDVDVPEGLVLITDPGALDLAFRSLLENGLDHGGGAVSVSYAGPADGGASALFEVRDDGPGVPDHERAVIEAGEETDLAHGSGLGLWLVAWGMAAVGGDVSFEDPPDGGTVVRLRVPGLVERSADAA